MIEPTKKSEGVENVLTKLAGGDRREAIKNGVCLFCNASVTPESFTDAISNREYAISAMCQACQDKTFGGGDALHD